MSRLPPPNTGSDSLSPFATRCAASPYSSRLR